MQMQSSIKITFPWLSLGRVSKVHSCILRVVENIRQQKCEHAQRKSVAS